MVSFNDSCTVTCQESNRNFQKSHGYAETKHGEDGVLHSPVKYIKTALHNKKANLKVTNKAGVGHTLPDRRSLLYRSRISRLELYSKKLGQ